MIMLPEKIFSHFFIFNNNYSNLDLNISEMNKIETNHKDKTIFNNIADI